MFTKKRPPAGARVTWTNPESLSALLHDIDTALEHGHISAKEAQELRHDICGMWGVLYL